MTSMTTTTKMTITEAHSNLIDTALNLESSGPIAPAPTGRAPPPPPSPPSIIIDIDTINTIPSDYPDELKKFAEQNPEKVNLPPITTNQGIGIALMTHNPGFYWNRDTCNAIFKKFNKESKDPIQAFNKANQSGLDSSSGKTRNKYYIVYPYRLSKKHQMRKGFQYSGSEEERNIEIDNIKSTIKEDYTDVPNDKWQLGHKNPDNGDNSDNNLLLQPPIQGKYRDNYIFIDSITKMPTPKKLKTMIEKEDIKLSHEQIMAYKALFDNLANDIS